MAWSAASEPSPRGNLPRRLFLRRALVTGAAVAGGGLLAACQQAVQPAPAPTAAPAAAKPTTAPASMAKGTLNLALWSEPAKAHVSRQIALFTTANPNVEVKVTVTPFKDYWTKLQTSLAGKSGPDAFWMNGPNFRQYASLGLLKDVQPLVQKNSIDVTAYDRTLVSLYSYKGSLHGMPSFLDDIALLYNKELLDRAKVPYPDASWTWDTLMENARKLTAKDKGIYGYTADINNQNGYYNLIYQAGGYIINEEKTKSGFDQPETQAALQWMVDLMNEGIAPPAQVQIETGAQQLFGSGLAAMHPTLPPQMVVLYKELGDKLGIAELPKGKRRATVVHGISWAVNSSTQNPEAAWELVKTLTGPEAQTILAESGFSIPARTSATDAWLKSVPGVNLKVFVDSLSFGFPYPTSKNTTQWQEVEKKEFRDAFLGKKSVAEATKTVAARMNEILAKEQSG